MSYTNRNRYTSRREKFAQNKRKARMVLIFATLAGIVLIFKNRVALYDWFRLMFY